MRPLLALPLLLTLTAASQGMALPVHHGGRVAADGKGGVSFGWPGVYFEGRFRGSEVEIRLNAGGDFFRVLVDGDARTTLPPGSRALRIDDLPPGEHVVRLEKLTESQSGSAQFRGFWTANGQPLPQRPRARKIEFIGDSHTVGYGNTAAGRECTPQQVHDTTDTQQAFGPLLAKRLDADYRVVAYSGYGIVRNYNGGVPGDSLPNRYPRAIPGDPAPAKPDGWAPQIIVINLGTNDFSTKVKPGERWKQEAALRSDYRRAYGAFLDRLHAGEPKARFILMAADNFLAEVRTVAKAAAARHLPVSVIAVPQLEMTGCDWHPSLKDHRTMADLVGAEIEKLGVYKG